jgi:DNA-directed RNA polymerase specialized sigma24 family protein
MIQHYDSANETICVRANFDPISTDYTDIPVALTPQRIYTSLRIEAILSKDELSALIAQYQTSTDDATRRALRTRIGEQFLPMLRSLVVRRERRAEDQLELLHDAMVICLELLDTMPQTDRPLSYLYKAVGYRLSAVIRAKATVQIPEYHESRVHAFSFQSLHTPIGDDLFLGDLIADPTTEVMTDHASEAVQALEMAFHDLSERQQQALKEQYRLEFEVVASTPTRKPKCSRKHDEASEAVKKGRTKKAMWERVGVAIRKLRANQQLQHAVVWGRG